MKYFMRYIQRVNLKNFFEQIGLSEVYDYLRVNVIMNNMTFMVVTAFLFLMIFAGYQFDSTAIKIIAILVLLFLLFFKLTIMF